MEVAGAACLLIHNSYFIIHNFLRLDNSTDHKDSLVMDDAEKIMLTTLTRKQRRVLGTLLEKAFTTPDQYPLTLKAATTGCNQKSNRDPVVEYDEDDVQQTLDQLREIGLIGEVHTDGGRAARYRHYMRQKTSFSEPQLAILTELMLRGRQQMGELRGRASRMVEIDSLEKLRSELQPLLEQGLVRANGSLERRGVEVDHNLYPAGENREEMSAISDESDASERPTPAPRPATPSSSGDTVRIAKLETDVSNLKDEVAELHSELAALKDHFDELRKQLGA
jgi:uncharacterized protein YceH (UPF0502 family)